MSTRVRSFRRSPLAVVLLAMAMLPVTLSVTPMPAGAQAAGGTPADGRIDMQPVAQTTADIGARQANLEANGKVAAPPPRVHPLRPIGHDKVAPDVDAPEAKQSPQTAQSSPAMSALDAQTVTTEFDGATGPAETGLFPPDSMGAPGPSQFFVAINGRLRTFNKTTGVADGVINADPDVFFLPVMSVPAGGEVVFTTDPQVRYDRLSGRWFLTIIDIILTNPGNALARQNRVLVAVSDAASAGIISGATVWTFYQFQGDATLFTDYPSLGIDANALYIGANMFTLAEAFDSTKGFVIPIAPLLTASPATVWAFSGLVATPSYVGPWSPRGVDNPDPANVGPTAVGYFIGVDFATFNKLMIRRVTNPASLGPAPTISANISVVTPLPTRFPVLVPHLGNTGGAAGRLDSLDDRLYAASMRNGRLWTAQNIGVNNTGVAVATNNRNAARWYELQSLDTVPSVLQSGTVFDSSLPNDANQLNYWIPSIAVSGQGHAAMGGSVAGTNHRVDAWTTGRLVGDPLGTMQPVFEYTATTFAYNPPGDPGGASGRRWGDYSFTSVDPNDDMTMWTIQEYTNGENTYGLRVAKLLAPPPATPVTALPASVPAGVPSTNVTVTGTQVAGSGFFDPGPGFLNHLSAAVSGGVTVNSATYVNPTTVTLNVSTVGAGPGAKDVTITNPDGQSLAGNSIFTVTPAGFPLSLPAVVAGAVNWSMHDALATPGTDNNFVFGTQPAVVPLIGDWDGNGTKTPGIFQGGAFKLSNSTTANPTPAASFTFGDPRGFPVGGDFNGDGTDDVAVYKAGQWQIRLSTGVVLPTFSFGPGGTWPNTVPVAGDWDGDGTDGIGTYTYATGVWNLNNAADNSAVDIGPFVYTAGAGSYPVVGDWDASGTDTVGVRLGTTWSLKDTNNAGFVPTHTFTFGAANTIPLAWH